MQNALDSLTLNPIPAASGVTGVTPESVPVLISKRDHDPQRDPTHARTQMAKPAKLRAVRFFKEEAPTRPMGNGRPRERVARAAVGTGGSVGL
jgi:hypothetical protein